MDFMRGSMLAFGISFPCWTDSVHLNWRIVKLSAHPDILSDNVRYKFVIFHFDIKHGYWEPITSEQVYRYLNGLHVHKFLGSFTLTEAKYLCTAAAVAMGE